MSFTELLDAVKALPPVELQELLETVQSQAAAHGPAESKTDYRWQIATEELTDGTALLESDPSRSLTNEEMFADSFPHGVPIPIFTPLDCFEAAAALQEFLDAEKARR